MGAKAEGIKANAMINGSFAPVILSPDDYVGRFREIHTILKDAMDAARMLPEETDDFTRQPKTGVRDRNLDLMASILMALKKARAAYGEALVQAEGEE